MNMPENLRKLIDALRSGKFKKNIYSLRFGEACCVQGVACELAADEGVVTRTNHDLTFYYNDNAGVAPIEVRRWLGLSFGFRRTVEVNGHKVGGFIAMNDSTNATFPEMADVIEREFYHGNLLPFEEDQC